MLFTDQLGRSIQLEVVPPKRIISLVPSQTEYLAYLGLEEEVVGITKFCTHPPEWFQSKPKIGGTKTIHFEKLQALAPELLIANKEENDKTQLETLASRYPVWISDIYNLEDALDMILRLGEITRRSSRAVALEQAVRQEFAHLPTPGSVRRPRTAYFIWRKPYMVAASQTFIHSMLETAGFENVFAHLSRYPEITDRMLAEAAPEVLFLSSEPYPFQEKHIRELNEICPQAIIQLVDGAVFSWYGSRLAVAPAYFQTLRMQLNYP